MSHRGSSFRNLPLGARRVGRVRSVENRLCSHCAIKLTPHRHLYSIAYRETGFVFEERRTFWSSFRHIVVMPTPSLWVPRRRNVCGSSHCIADRGEGCLKCAMPWFWSPLGAYPRRRALMHLKQPLPQNRPVVFGAHQSPRSSDQSPSKVTVIN